ncbi:MAG: NAD(P)-binding domain-containing protein [Anaerolineae bacterium]|nr:NAD(P)-binding domain-containing protein [Anaerolineae bacterium]
MKIAVLGAKIIGSTLARKWAAAGHDIKLGVRNVDNPETLTLAHELGVRASVGSTAEAIAFGEVVLFAIPGDAMEQVVHQYGSALNGKIVIDAANRIGSPIPNSLAIFEEYAPQAVYARAFNNLGWENFAEPALNDTQIDLIYCCEPGARETLDGLIRDVGLNPVWVGGNNKIELVDLVLRLWFNLAYEQKMGRRLAFKVMR